ncbi:hypothetical protein N657DRAFT_649933 [Parathielavia appendiculata]|uniref:Uncharacterized protein n=1 Tax=Parathielavia appendiculata TaxID=2587402 RepID=A0AAN6TS44_9PEZI|nr:hypothetical protein N657DRAFT_649933 [Parathielavia appendiculata]
MPRSVCEPESGKGTSTACDSSLAYCNIAAVVLLTSIKQAAAAKFPAQRKRASKRYRIHDLSVDVGMAER